MLQICDMASQRTVILATVAMRITSNTPRHEIYFHSLSKTKANEQKQQQQKIPHKIETRPFELVHWFFIVCVFLFVAFGSVHSYIYIYIFMAIGNDQKRNHRVYRRGRSPCAPLVGCGHFVVFIVRVMSIDFVNSSNAVDFYWRASKKLMMHSIRSGDESSPNRLSINGHC